VFKNVYSHVCYVGSQCEPIVRRFMSCCSPPRGLNDLKYYTVFTSWYVRVLNAVSYSEGGGEEDIIFQVIVNALGNTVIPRLTSDPANEIFV